MSISHLIPKSGKVRAGLIIVIAFVFQFLFANTVPGKGVRHMEYDYKWHGKPATRDQADLALTELTKEALR